MWLWCMVCGCVHGARGEWCACTCDTCACACAYARACSSTVYTPCLVVDGGIPALRVLLRELRLRAR